MVKADGEVNPLSFFGSCASADYAMVRLFLSSTRFIDFSFPEVVMGITTSGKDH
jgi:hypothetical protein